MANSFADIDQPCGGISVDGSEPPICEVHLEPWGHRRPKPCTCPTDADIDAAIDAANDRLHRKD